VGLACCVVEELLLVSRLFDRQQLVSDSWSLWLNFAVALKDMEGGQRGSPGCQAAEIGKPQG
jgi:hypothetical protein